MQTRNPVAHGAPSASYSITLRVQWKSRAGTLGKHELSEDYIIPSVFNRKLAQVVAKAVAQAAHSSGVARKRRTHLNRYHA